MKKNTWYIAALFILATAFASCTQKTEAGEGAGKETTEVKDTLRIVSLSGTLTEVLCGLGFEEKIVGVDVTSTYPESVQKLPKTGHTRTPSAEGILTVNPTVVVGFTENVNDALKEQLETAGIKVILYEQEYSITGIQTLIADVARAFNASDKADAMVKQIDTDLAAKITPAQPLKVLFIYARGAGTMMVAGEKTSADQMIVLAGGVNAVSGFEDYKPLTPEALVSANPDVILMFDSGLQSVGGMDGLLAVPGVAGTNAGKNKRVIEMDGQYLAGFGPRVGKAAAELSKRLDELAKP